MIVRLNGKCEGGLSFEQAIQICNGELKSEELSVYQRQQIEPDGEEKRILLGKGSYVLSQSVTIKCPVTIEGSCAEIILEDTANLTISASDVLVEGLIIKKGLSALVIDGGGKQISNIRVVDCRFDQFMLEGIMVCSTKSNSLVENIQICRCELNSGILPGANQVWGSAIGIGISAGFALDEPGVNDSYIKKVLISDCRMRGKSRCNICCIVGISAKESRDIWFRNCHIEDLEITGNDVSGAMDTAICTQPDYINHQNCSFNNIRINNNRVEMGIFGISCSGAYPVAGIREGVVSRDIEIIGNEVIGREGGCGEPSYAIAISAGSPGCSESDCRNSHVENIKILKNHIRAHNRGIVIAGAHSVFDWDAPASLTGNYVSDIEIRENLIEETDTCFIFCGAWSEGRRRDWKFSYNSVEQEVAPQVSDHRKTTLTMRNNSVKNLLCRDNRCRGFRYFLVAAGAKGRGHAFMEGNRLDDNIVISNNYIEHGENHQIVADQFMEDWCSGADNRVLPDLRYCIDEDKTGSLPG